MHELNSGICTLDEAEYPRCFTHSAASGYWLRESLWTLDPPYLPPHNLSQSMEAGFQKREITMHDSEYFGSLKVQVLNSLT